MNIPVIIVNYNRLRYLRGMVQVLRTWGMSRIIVLDNASTYPPLLDYYQTGDLEVHPVGENLGHLAPWFSGFVDRLDTRYYVVTDPDLDLTRVPADGLSVLMRGLHTRPNIQKCGFGIEINDLPPDFPLRDEVRQWEARFWMKRCGEMFFEAPIDTTFALYEKGRPLDHGLAQLPCLRADRPYVVRHLPWYLTPESVTEEDAYYFRSCETYCHWSGAIMTRFGL